MSTRHVQRLFLACLASLLLAFAGCNGSSTGSGTLNLSITDTPVDGATSVIVTFTGVDIQPAGTESDDDSGDMGDMSGMGGMDNDDDDAGSQRLTFNFDTPRQIDLLQQQGGASAALLSGVSLPAGHYAWIRLKIDASQSSITLADGTHPLFIPSGAQTGLKLVHGFDVAQGGIVDFTIDFDLRRSITLAHGQYILKPVLRLMDELDSGHIDGSASNTLVVGSLVISDPACMPAAYVYSGSNATPVDINPTSSVQPVTSVALKLDNMSGNYVYAVGFLAPGDYTVALACGALDDPGISDSLVFSASKNVAVTAGGTATVDFP